MGPHGELRPDAYWDDEEREVDEGGLMRVPEGAMESCLIELGYSIFNFEPLALPGSDYQVVKMRPAEGTNYTLYFNLCQYTNHDCPDRLAYDLAHSVNENNTCVHNSG